MQPPRSLVIVKLSAIGDVLHGVPVAVAAKRAFPMCRIGWVVEGRAADVLAGHPAIDHLFRMPRGWLTSATQVASLRRQLRAFTADVAIDLQGLLKSGVASWLSGAPVRIGHAAPAAREQAWRAYTHRVRATMPHVVEQNCDLLAPLGVVATMPEFDMPHWPVSRLRMQHWLQAQRLGGPPAIINPGAGWASKRWPVERFTAVARGLLRQDGVPTIVVWAGAAERAAAERIVADACGAAVLAPQTTLQDLGELARLARVFISGDTGPLHLAAAVGTPCVGIFGPVPASRNGPYGRGHACAEPVPELRPAWNNRKTDTLSIQAVQVDDVLAAAGNLLARSQAA
ncbi:MAG: glycosyltransferase family 9 protein [Planctomycetaceae bacterium]